MERSQNWPDLGSRISKFRDIHLIDTGTGVNRWKFQGYRSFGVAVTNIQSFSRWSHLTWPAGLTFSELGLKFSQHLRKRGTKRCAKNLRGYPSPRPGADYCRYDLCNVFLFINMVDSSRIRGRKRILRRRLEISAKKNLRGVFKRVSPARRGLYTSMKENWRTPLLTEITIWTLSNSGIQANLTHWIWNCNQWPLLMSLKLFQVTKGHRQFFGNVFLFSLRAILGSPEPIKGQGSIEKWSGSFFTNARCNSKLYHRWHQLWPPSTT